MASPLVTFRLSAAVVAACLVVVSPFHQAAAACDPCSRNWVDQDGIFHTASSWPFMRLKSAETEYPPGARGYVLEWRVPEYDAPGEWHQIWLSPGSSYLRTQPIVGHRVVRWLLYWQGRPNSGLTVMFRLRAYNDAGVSEPGRLTVALCLPDPNDPTCAP